jgi:hypothetical protein
MSLSLGSARAALLASSVDNPLIRLPLAGRDHGLRGFGKIADECGDVQAGRPDVRGM